MLSSSHPAAAYVRSPDSGKIVSAGTSGLYVTERWVLRLCPAGLELIEIAQGVDLERDILAHMAFSPVINGEPALMDARLRARTDEPACRAAGTSVRRAPGVRRGQ